MKKLLSKLSDTKEKKDAPEPISISAPGAKWQPIIVNKNVIVRTVTGKRISFSMPPNATVEALKKKVEESERIPLDRQILSYNNAPLENHRQLALPDSAVVDLTLDHRVALNAAHTEKMSYLNNARAKPIPKAPEAKAPPAPPPSKPSRAGGGRAAMLQEIVAHNPEPAGSSGSTPPAPPPLPTKVQRASTYTSPSPPPPPPPLPPMSVTARKKLIVNLLPAGKKLNFFYETRDSVLSLKRQIEEQEKIPVANQRLLYNDIALNDSAYLKDCRLPNEAFLSLFVNLAGPKAPTRKNVPPPKANVQPDRTDEAISDLDDLIAENRKSSPQPQNTFETLYRSSEFPSQQTEVPGTFETLYRSSDATQQLSPEHPEVFQTIAQTSNYSQNNDTQQPTFATLAETIIQQQNAPPPPPPRADIAPPVPARKNPTAAGTATPTRTETPPRTDSPSTGGSGILQQSIGADHLIIDHEDIKFEARIGGGSFGDVFKGRHAGMPVAIKKLRRKLDADNVKEFLSEAQVMTRLLHPRVVILLAYTNPALDEPCLVMEWMEGGSLWDALYVKKKPIRPAAIAKHVAQGLAFLHQKRPPIIHRDIKSPNVLLDAHGDAKLADFGLAKIKATESGLQSQLAGSPVWMAPEMIADLPYSAKADVYSYAMVLFELCMKELPWKGKNQVQLFHAVTVMNERPALRENLPAEWVALIKRCWARDPAQRPTMLSIVEDENLPEL